MRSASELTCSNWKYSQLWIFILLIIESCELNLKDSRKGSKNRTPRNSNSQINWVTIWRTTSEHFFFSSETEFISKNVFNSLVSKNCLNFFCWSFFLMTVHLSFSFVFPSNIFFWFSFSEFILFEFSSWKNFLLVVCLFGDVFSTETKILFNLFCSK